MMGIGMYCIGHLNCLTGIKIRLDSKVWVLEGLWTGVRCEMTGSEQGKDSALAATIEATLFDPKMCRFGAWGHGLVVDLGCWVEGWTLQP